MFLCKEFLLEVSIKKKNLKIRNKVEYFFGISLSKLSMKANATEVKSTFIPVTKAKKNKTW